MCFVRKDNIMNNHKHITTDDRIVIKSMILKKKSLRQIALAINKNVTSISREIKRNRTFHQGHLGDKCKYVKLCRKGPGCDRNCSNYEKDSCIKLISAPWVCDGCENLKYCKKHKYRYLTANADSYASKRLINSRRKLQCDCYEITRINKILTPLIRDKHQSLSHVYATHCDELGLSLSTLYRYIDKGILEINNSDLPARVRYKKHKKYTSSFGYKVRIGRTYTDFKAYCKKHNNANVFEFDTVISHSEGNHKVFLTILFRKSTFMLVFLLNEKTTRAVVDKFDELERRLETVNFANLFRIGLTDNGGEFKDVNGLECLDRKYKRMNVFYCDAGASYQKGAIEKNHEYIRKYIPKGKSFDHLTDEDIKKMVNHINSIIRPRLSNKSPFQMLSKKELKLIQLLGYKAVKPDDVIVDSSLFNQ